MRFLVAITSLWLVACSGGGGTGFHGIFGGGDDGGGSDASGNNGGDGAVGSKDMAGMNMPVPDLQVIPDLTRMPDLSIPCLPGHYVGPVTGKFTVSNFVFNVTGTVDLMLAAPVGSLLQIVNGQLSATGGGGTFAATLTGDVDCDQRAIVNGQMVNGMGSAFGVMIPFTGTAGADYTVATHSLDNGTCAANAFMGSCSWSAKLQ